MASPRIKLHNPERKFEIAINRLSYSEVILPENKELILGFIKHLREINPRIAYGRLLRLITTFKTCESWFNKPFSEVTKQECREVIRKLINNEIKRKSILIQLGRIGGDYSETTKLSYVKNLRQLFRWIYLESKNKPQYDGDGRQLTFDQIFVGFSYQVDQDRIKEPTIVTLEQAELIADSSNLRLGTLMMVGFDTGFRPEELWNVKLKDVQWDTEKKKYWIYCQFPKKNSKKRVIDVIRNLYNIIDCKNFISL